MSILLLILGLLLFVGLVVVHEFGHFIMARRNGVDVEEFGIGFPPRVWGKKLKSGILFTINVLPLGGFVRLKGENDSARAKGSFGAASLGTKVKIMLAGVVMNLITAFILFTLLALIGVPQIIKDQFTVSAGSHVVREAENEGVIVVAEVSAGLPAEQAGIQKGDEIISLAGEPVDYLQDLSQNAEAHAGESVPVVIQRDGALQTVQVKLKPADNAQNGYLGVKSESLQRGLGVIRYTWTAPLLAAGTMKQVTELTLKGLGSVVQGLGSLLAGLLTGNSVARQAGQEQASEQVSGPLGIFVVLRESSSLGLSFTIFIIAVISLTLAIMNVLPIPALDGGRLFVTLLFRGLRKPLTKKAEELIHGTGFAALMVLFVLITIVDVRRFF
jgi:regulator of sigma E protease